MTISNDQTTQELQSWSTASSDPLPEQPAARAPTKPKNRSKRLLVGAAVLGCAGIGAYAVFGHEEAASAALPAADVPRTQGRKIVFSDKFRDRLGVKLVEAKQAPLTPVVTAVGVVDFDPEHVAAVGTRLRGLVRKVKRFEGDVVKKGDLLAEIDSPELGEAQAEVTSLKAQHAAATRNTDRERELSEKNLSTEREYEVAEAQLTEYGALLNAAQQKVAALGGAVLDDNGHGGLGVHQLRAPLAGTVVERNVFPGQSVEGHLVAFKVANLDRVWVELAVFDRSLPGISLADRVEITPLHRATDPIIGRVARIGAQIDPHTRSASVRIEIDNSERKLRPGQSVNAKIHTSATTTEHVSVVVPSKALSYIDGKPVLFVAEGPNAVTVNDVELGESNGPDQQIQRGVRVGQKVVTDGVFALKSELFR
jgi:cobalt-zinc-cadmium efflux system membrane fusion protein